MKPLAGLIAGIIFGYLSNVSAVDTQIFLVILMAALLSIIGGLLAKLDERFSDTAFLSGFALNLLFAALLIYLGKIFGLELYYIALIVFGLRIFRNLAGIKGRLLKRYGN